MRKRPRARRPRNRRPPGGSGLKLEVAARPIEPIKNLVGFASVKFNDCFVVEDFKILQSDKGLFVGMPSKPDKSSKYGYRDTAKPITAEFRKELHGAILEAYQQEVEKLQARAAAVRQTPPPGKGIHQGTVGVRGEEGGKGESRPRPEGEAREGGGAVSTSGQVGPKRPRQKGGFDWQERNQDMTRPATMPGNWWAAVRRRTVKPIPP
ncbi:MAG: septation protein SpoVG family protein [[Clostridium] symbiosum]